MNYSHELEVAKKAASEAAAIIREYADRDSFNVNLKGKNDLVTEADLESEKKIIGIIKKAFSGDEFLAEETTNLNRLPEGRVWIIDPIDGTTNFAHGFPVYCISIALWEDAEPKVGLVYEVANDELFSAVAGGGAYLNYESIKISGIDDPSASLIGTGFPYKDFDLVDNYLKFFRTLMHKTHGVRRPGSAAWDLCNIACGRFEGFYEYGLSAWDVAAGSLIIKEAGGVITDWKGGNDWLFGQRIITGSKAIHAFLLEEIQEHFEEEELSRR